MILNILNNLFIESDKIFFDLYGSKMKCKFHLIPTYIPQINITQDLFVIKSNQRPSLTFKKV